jgi:ferredoxin
MKEILDLITAGKATGEDLELLEELARGVKDASLCGLGQTAPNPVLSTLRYFRDEYEAHVRTGRCPAGVCRALIRYEIVADQCNGCGACVRPCPVNAITGTKNEVHLLDGVKCTKCGSCLEACHFDAVIKVS